MHRLLFCLALLICLMYSGIQQAYGQGVERQVVTQFNSWFAYFGTHDIADKWQLWAEVQVRRHDFLDKHQQWMLRGALQYVVDDPIKVSGGYAFVNTYPYGAQPVAAEFVEHRVYQQLLLLQKIPLGRIRVSHRYRQEQRWLAQMTPGRDGTFTRTGWNFQHRTRYLLRMDIPLKEALWKGVELFLPTYHEVFINYGRKVQHNVFDQYRLFAGAGFRFVRNSSVQIGYLMHYWQKADGVRYELNHTLNVNFFYNLPFRKLAGTNATRD